MPARRTNADRERYWALRNDQNLSKMEAARQVGISKNTATAWEKGIRNANGRTRQEIQKISGLRVPLRRDQLGPEALRALDDFEFFRRRYMGRISSPWQVDAANKFVLALESEVKEYIVLNCPPGAGKSTLLHDIEAWLTCRNRALRGILGSSVQRMAIQYCQRLKRTFERVIPVQGDPDEVAAGRALDAVTTIAKDYGRFQTDVSDVWTQESFVVAQLGDVAIEEKEPTWQAFGLDTGYLGTRVNIAVWDDVVTKRTMRTLDSIEGQRDKWDDEAETRLEPAGALFLVGQRLGPNDLYRYNLDKPAAFVDEDDPFEDGDELAEPYLIEPEGSQTPRMYHRIVYPAHDEVNCKGIHKRKEAKHWPEGCLLDPWRLPWSELSRIQTQRNDKYRTVYQQEDVDPASVLVRREWVQGGNHNGEELPGCYDIDRGMHELPRGIDLASVYSIVTVDPSPTKFWAIEWWLYHQDSELRYLMDLTRQKMTADQFLDYDPLTRTYSGALEDLWQLTYKLGCQFRHLIIERNGAQRFLMQFDVFKSWCQLRGVSYYPHDTTSNKSDPEFGVQILATHYRHGRYRLPNKQTSGDMAFLMTKKLVDEVTVYPSEGATDDCVMAQWFLEWWIPRLVMPNMENFPKRRLPSWQQGNGYRTPASQRLEIRRRYPNGLHIVQDEPLQEGA